MSTFEAVFFDMDGTFVNSEPHWLKAERELMLEYGHEWTLVDQQYCVGGPLSKVGEYMWQLAGKSNSPEWFHQELVNRTVANFHTNVQFMPGAFELLQEIKGAGLPVGLVTASPAVMMNATLNAVGLNLFDVAISGDDVSITKPHPECYLQAAKKLGVNIQRSLILEDSQTGISAARASGGLLLAVPTFMDLIDSEQFQVVPTLDGLELSHIEVLFASSLMEGSV